MSVIHFFLNCLPSNEHLIEALSKTFEVLIDQIEVNEDVQHLHFDHELNVTIIRHDGEYSVRLRLGSKNHPLMEENIPYKLGYLCELLKCQGVTLEFPEHNEHGFWGLAIYARNDYQQILLSADKLVKNKEIAILQKGKRMTDLEDWDDEAFPFG